MQVARTLWLVFVAEAFLNLAELDVDVELYRRKHSFNVPPFKLNVSVIKGPILAVL